LARNKQKSKALQALKQAKATDARATEIGAMSANLRTIQGTIQDSSALGDYIALLKDAYIALANAVMVEDVEILRDDLDERMAQHQEISDLIAAPIGPVGDDATDEQELEDMFGQDDEEALAPQGDAAALTDEEEMANLMAGVA
jgi:hypothetical protein